MQITRRDLAIAGAFVLGSSELLAAPAALAETDAAAVDQAVEALRKALLEADKAQLEKLTADQVSYGHSDGRVQNKAEFLDGVMTRKAIVKSITFPELKVGVIGNAAIARHISQVVPKMPPIRQSRTRLLAKTGALLRRTNFRNRYHAEGGHACTGWSCR